MSYSDTVGGNDEPALLEAKRLLQAELINEPINALKVRSLCKEHPGLIAATSLRLRIWSILLIGKADVSSSSSGSDTNDPSAIIGETRPPCQEQQVLEADVRRTRADIEEFRTAQYRKFITEILQGFCLKHDIQYKQGMNEVLAPFIYLSPPPDDHPSIAFNLFEAFIARYLERYFYLDDSSFLFKAFRLFHQLLVYHDPQLALHLHDNGFPPELYSPQWFLTLYSRALPINQVLRLWDMIIAIDDPAFTFFVGLCLLRRLRNELLLAEIDSIPEIFKQLHFNGEEDIDIIVSEAIRVYKATPRSFCRNLRLCCVSTAELAVGTGPSQQQQHQLKPQKQQQLKQPIANHNLSRNIAIQSVRSCVMISPQELVGFLNPLTLAASASSSSSSGRDGSDESPPGTNSAQQHPLQFVLIDLRPDVDIRVSGGGLIPRAISLEPDFIDQPDAFERWLQHFDGTRGCNLCIIDLPPGQASAISLWRRLLLGDGDGTQASINYTNVTQLLGATTTGPRDFQSIYAQEELSVAEEERVRPSIRLAQALQRASFPSVSVLDGGFPALIDYLNESRGGVEPIVINHDAELWSEYVRNTGRTGYSLSSTAPLGKTKSQNSNSSSPSRSPKPTDTATGSGGVPNELHSPAKRSRDLSQLEMFEIGLTVAVRLGHTNTAKVLKEKIAAMKGE